jgi:DNA polymerase-1
MGNGMEIQGVKEILEKWEIDHVEQVIDILGLWGDAVDNIPGIPGIGEKTAKQLIKQYGSIENIISNSHELKGKLRENVENFAEQGLISKKLATIMLNAPVDLDVDALHVDEPNRDVLEPLFAELEFRTLGKRVFGDEFSIADGKSSPGSGQMDLFGNHEAQEPANSNKREETSLPQMPLSFKNISNTDHNYQVVDKEQKLPDLMPTIVNLLDFHSVLNKVKHGMFRSRQTRMNAKLS